MKAYKQLPNFITLLNLFFGCLSIILIFNGYPVAGAYMIGIAAIFDFADGFMARLLKANSELGKQLDSLADVVSFGLAPGMILYYLISQTANSPHLLYYGIYLPGLVAMLVPIFSALRLAKFNIDEEQTDKFIGLPTPASALFIASLPLIIDAGFPGWTWLQSILSMASTFIIISLVLSFLLVANIPLFSIKFKDFSLKNNWIRYVFLIVVLAFVFILKFAVVPFAVIAYIFMSLLFKKYV